MGDIVGYGANPKECLEIIKKLKLPCLIGNHEWAIIKGDTSWFNPVASQAIWWTIDRLVEEDFEFIKTFKERVDARESDLKFLLVHGSPQNPIWEYIHEENVNEDFIKNLDYNVVVMGHTHIPFVKKVQTKRGKGCLVINCGSVGQPRDRNNKASFALLDTNKQEAEIIRVEYDIKDAAEKIIKARLPEFLAHQLYLGV